MLRKMIDDGIKASDGHTIVSTGALSKPLFEITWAAINDFVNERKVGRRFKPDNSGELILDTLRKLDEISRARTA